MRQVAAVPGAGPPGSDPVSRFPVFLVFILPPLCALVAYWRTRGVPFLLDDLTAFAFLNPKGPFSFEHVPGLLWPSDPGHSFHGHFRPLGWASIILDDLLFGPNPAALRLVGVLLHGLSASLVALITWKGLARRSLGAPLLAGLIFALHPAAVEPTVWVAHRFTLLATLFYLCALLSLLHFSGHGRGGVLLAAFSALALASKDSMISGLWTLPLLSLVLAPAGLRRSRFLGAALFVGLGWGLLMSLRWWATGALLPRFEDSGSVASTFDLLASLQDLPSALLALAVPAPPTLPWRPLVTLCLLVLSAGGLVLARRRAPTLVRLALPLLVLLAGAFLPVLRVREDLEGSRQVHLLLAPWAMLLSCLALTRWRWLSLAAVLPLLLGTVTTQDAYLGAGRRIALVKKAILERLPEDRPVGVAGLPSTYRSAPLFGPGCEHLSIRFRPPFHPRSLRVEGIGAGRWSHALDDIGESTRMLVFDGTALLADPPLLRVDVWDLRGPEEIPEPPRELALQVPAPGTSWAGRVLVFSLPQGFRGRVERVLRSIRCDALTGNIVLDAASPTSSGSLRLSLTPERIIHASLGLQRIWAASAGRQTDVLVRAAVVRAAGRRARELPFSRWRRVTLNIGGPR